MRLARGQLLIGPLQVRGKKNLVIEKSLAGPIGLFVKFTTLQDYGVDKLFFLENGNADTSQRNVVFIARGECGKQAPLVACMWYFLFVKFHIRFLVDSNFGEPWDKK